MERALDFFIVEGIDTTIPLHRRILQHPRFRAGDFSTRFMEAFLEPERTAEATPERVVGGV